MRFNLFGNKSILKDVRENYVKEFKINGEIKITPCSKFVACMEKLSKNYVLALKDITHSETLQVANKSDIEFYEGYEFATEYTDSLRSNLCKTTSTLYGVINEIVNTMNLLINKIPDDKKNVFNDIKLDILTLNNIVLNIFKHLTMTNDMPVIEYKNQPYSSIEDLLRYLKNLILKAIEELLNIEQGLIIEYITKQVNLIINKFLMYLEEINKL